VRYAPLKKALKEVASPLLDLSGLYDARLESAMRRGPSWMILMYHRVIDDRTQDPFALGMCVTRQRFEQQIAYVRRHFEVLAVREVFARLQRGDALPERVASITFDDGYRDNLSHALPVLEKHGVPMTLFVVSGGVEEGTPFWWDRVIASVWRTQSRSVDLAKLGLAGETRELPLSRLHRGESLEHLLELLWDGAPGDVPDVVQRIEATLGPGAEHLLPARLSPQEIASLHARGVEIGAHSVSHRNLALMNDTEVRAEMKTSKTYLETLCQDQIAGFAYPAGKSTEAVKEAARAGGFTYALTTARGLNRAVFDPFNLMRIGMPDSSVADFKRCLGTIARLAQA
jgi:peptidoglycan/xylan/chitin deacetylase (PgdA/CDA1 family)